MRKWTGGAGVLIFLIAVAIGVLAIGFLSGPERPEFTETLGELADPSSVYDPVRAGERLPPGFRQLLPRDGILPVYDPAFAEASEIDWRDGTLVLGLEIDGDARAYPISHLNRREMVIDRVNGIPVLVTW